MSRAIAGSVVCGIEVPTRVLDVMVVLVSGDVHGGAAGHGDTV
jgi:hypothetical protein